MNMRHKLTGWILSVDPDEQDGAVLWMLGEDHNRYRLTQAFRTTFYVAGEHGRLRDVADFVSNYKYPPMTTFVTRRELYQGDIPVLMIEVANPIAQEKLFYMIKRRFKKLQYYDAKIPFPIRYRVAKKVFPTAKCQAVIDEDYQIQRIEALDDCWDQQYNLPPLRSLWIEPDIDPNHATPTSLYLKFDNTSQRIELKNEHEALVQVQRTLDSVDPDVVLACWGDSWLFPKLLEIAEKHKFDFNPGREKRKKYLLKKSRAFESYGSIYFRSEQTFLYGRWHIDPKNSTMDMGFNFNIISAIELARVTSVSVQTAARNSPGSGFTAMQIREALGRGVLIPLHKRQTERFKSAMQLNRADGGGINYRPIVGVHEKVAELDFFSMYPSIMESWNISGETSGSTAGKTRMVPYANIPVRQDIQGLVPAVLKPLLKKRLAIKNELRQLEEDTPRYLTLKSIADALKWLGYVSFGYQGYKNNLFGNIQAHEAICAVGREMLVRAIETAHEMGYKVFAANVDSLFVQKKGHTRPRDFQSLINAINKRTGLIIEMEGIFDWLIFTSSKLNPKIGAANRYFGKYSDSSLKVRGMAQRRSDTPNWIANAEREIMTLLANQANVKRLADLIPEAISFTQSLFAELDAERVPIEDLVCQSKLYRELHEYKGNSTSAKAARQLAAEGKNVRVGQRVKFIFTHGEKTSIFAWDLPIELDYSLVNKQRYKELLLRAVHQVLQPLGLEEEDLENLVYDNVIQLAV